MTITKYHRKFGSVLSMVMLLAIPLMLKVPVTKQSTLSQQNSPTVSQTAKPSATITITATVTPTPTINATDVNQQILDLQKLKLQNETNEWILLWNNFLPILSTLAVLVTAFLAFLQWQKDHRIAQTKRDDDYKKEQIKRHEDYLIEQAKLDEERFQKIVEGLGSDRIEARVGAAIMLLTFLQPGYEKFYSQTFLLAVAHLRLRKASPEIPEPLDAMSQAIITVFREAFWKARDNIKKFSPENLDSAGVHMDTAYLSQVDLRKIRVRNAFFRKSILWKAQLQGSYFKYSNFTEANLRHANLANADFSYTIMKNADLAGANFVNTDLTMVDLDGADMTNTNLELAEKLDGTILRHVIGLSAEQLAMCAAKGAIIDDIPNDEEYKI